MDAEHIKYVMERSCLRKANLTLEQANRIVDQSAEDGRIMYYYKCTFCCSFHMTSSEPYEPENPVQFI